MIFRIIRYLLIGAGALEIIGSLLSPKPVFVVIFWAIIVVVCGYFEYRSNSKKSERVDKK